MQLIKALIKLFQVGWWVGRWVRRWVGSMVGGWVILGLNLVQLKLEIQLGQNFGLFLVSVGEITYKISVGVVQSQTQLS